MILGKVSGCPMRLKCL